MAEGWGGVEEVRGRGGGRDWKLTLFTPAFKVVCYARCQED